jgi:hypothetical protein
MLCSRGTGGTQRFVLLKDGLETKRLKGKFKCQAKTTGRTLWTSCIKYPKTLRRKVQYAEPRRGASITIISHAIGQILQLRDAMSAVSNS